MTDLKLINACKKSDEGAQEELFLKFRRYAMGVCLRYTRSEEEARDILQEGFIKVFKSIKQLKDPNQLKSWIRKIMVNQCINHYHKNLKFDHHEIIDELEISDDRHQDVLSDISTEEILKLINKLPDGYRIVFNMYAIEGYSHDEIAEKLEITEVTSRTQLFKARRILKKQLTLNHHEAKRLI
ncbi:MAG: sigma-70 family RNA polymerase sigma factor [Cyclobacteriaceae bacterium]